MALPSICATSGGEVHRLATYLERRFNCPNAAINRRKFLGRPGHDYRVAANGGLVGIVHVPDHLAERLEAILSPRVLLRPINSRLSAC